MRLQGFALTWANRDFKTAARSWLWSKVRFVETRGWFYWRSPEPIRRRYRAWRRSP